MCTGSRHAMLVEATKPSQYSLSCLGRTVDAVGWWHVPTSAIVPGAPSKCSQAPQRAHSADERSPKAWGINDSSRLRRRAADWPSPWISAVTVPCSLRPATIGG
jgi:hypothetical protein